MSRSQNTPQNPIDFDDGDAQKQNDDNSRSILCIPCHDRNEQRILKGKREQRHNRNDRPKDRHRKIDAIFIKTNHNNDIALCICNTSKQIHRYDGYGVQNVLIKISINVCGILIRFV